MHDGVEPPAASAPNRRWKRWLVASAICLVTLALATATALPGRPATDEPPAASDPARTKPLRPLTEKETLHRDFVVSSTLKKRARAVLARDRRAFMADVDRRDKSFVAAQKRLFNNLKQVRFRHWRYVVTKDGYERPELAKKYGRAQIYLPPVVLHYAIDEYDERPLAVPIVMTFVKRGRDWQIASDSDVDSDLPERGHAEPWDRRAVVVGEGKHVLVVADAEDRADLRDLVALGDASVRRVAAMWPRRWTKKVVISAVRDQRLIETYFRTELQTSEDVAAIAVPQSTEVTNWVNDRPPNHEPELATYRVILNPRYFDPDNEFNAHLLTHEIAHVATGADTWSGAPTWLVEGAAEYTAFRREARSAGDIDPDELPETLARQVAKGEVYLPGYDFFQGDVEANYLVGRLACEYIADRYGEATLRTLYLRLGRVEREIDTLEVQGKAFRELLGVRTGDFQRGLAAYIKRGP